MTAASNRTLSLALTVSLALNLFLAGTLAGNWLGGGGAPTAYQPTAGASIAEFAETLPPAGWTALERSVRRRQGDVRARIAALNTARDRVARALARTPLDPGAVEAAFAELRVRSQDVQAAIHGAVRDMASGMSPRDRAYMARGLFLFAAPDGESGNITESGRSVLYSVPLM